MEIAEQAKDRTLQEIIDSIRDTDSDIEVLNTLQYLSSRSVRLDVEGSYYADTKQVKPTCMSIDLDSVIARYDMVDDVLLNQLIYNPHPNTQTDVHFGLLENVLPISETNMSFPMSYQKHLGITINPPIVRVLNPVALTIVEIAKARDWIRHDDIRQLVCIDDRKYIPVSTPGTPKPTVGSRFYPNHAESNNTFSLPTPENSDPVHGWIRLNPNAVPYEERRERLHEYMKCVRDVAAAVCYVYSPSNYHELSRMFVDENRKSNDGKCLGGMWIHRLAFIKMIADLERSGKYKKNKTSPNANVLMYIEETFHGKARCSSVKMNTDFLNSDVAELKECAQEAASNLSKKVCESMATDYSILRLNALHILKGSVVLGIGLQFEAQIQTDAGYYQLYPCRFSNASDDDKTDWIRKEYITGGLCRGLSGFVQSSIFTDYAVTRDKALLPPNRSPSTSVMNFMNGDQDCLLLRNQTYYNWMRYCQGEALLPYEAKFSTRLQFCRQLSGDRFFGTTSATDDEISGDINAADLCRNIEQFDRVKNINLSSAATKPGFRQEMAFLVESSHPSESSAFGHVANVLHHDITSVVCKMLQGPIFETLQDARRNTKFVELSVIVAYMMYLLNAYIFLYKMCLTMLMRETIDTLDRNTVCIFLKFIQDYLAIFYSGSTKPVEYSHKTITAKGAANVHKVKYAFSVNSLKLGNALNRPYCLLPTIPALLKEYMVENAFGNLKARNQVFQSRGFILTQPMNTEGSVKRKAKYNLVLKEGLSKSTGVIYQCYNIDCMNRYHFSSTALHSHLRDSKVCSASVPSNGISSSNSVSHQYETTWLSTEVVEMFNRQIEKECSVSPEHTLALSCVRDGKSIYINGDAGAGKSYLGRLLLRLCLMIHGDWVIKPYGRDKVFGLAFQGIACTNMGTLFTSVHKYLSIKDFKVLQPNRSDEEMQTFCRDSLVADPDLKNKLRTTEVLIIDEVGNIHETLGKYLVTFLKVARDDYSPFGGVQVIAMGQVTQGLPVEEKAMLDDSKRQFSWGRNEELLHNTRHINLKTLFRSDKDTKLQDLIKKARQGSLVTNDFKFMRNTCGENVKAALARDAQFDKKQAVTNLYYELDKVSSSNISFIKENEVYLNKYRKLQTVYAKDYCDEDVPDPAKDVFDEKSCVLDIESGITFDKELQMPAKLYVYIGMPVILTRNMWSNDLTKDHNLSKGTQGIITSFVTTYENGVESDSIQKIVVKLKLTSECGHEIEVERTLARQLGFSIRIPSMFSRWQKNENLQNKERPGCYARVKPGNNFSNSVQRSMFPFTYGKDLSWSSIQGLTLNMVCINLGPNALITSPKAQYSVPAIFYVGLSRVRSIKNVLIIWPEKKHDNYYERFLNCVDKGSVQFEKNWIAEAERAKDEYVLKALDQITLLDMQRNNYFRVPDPAFMSTVIIPASREDIEKDAEAQKVLHGLWKYIMLSVHFQFEKGFFLTTICNDGAKEMYDSKLKNYFNEMVRVQPLTAVFRNLKQYMLDNIAKVFKQVLQQNTYTTSPTFAWLTKEAYFAWGKEYIEKVKVYMFQRDPDLKTAHEKSAKYFESEVIIKEFSALTDTQKDEMNMKMSASAVLDDDALCIAARKEVEKRSENLQKRAREQFFNPYRNETKRMKIGQKLSERSKQNKLITKST